MLKFLQLNVIFVGGQPGCQGFILFLLDNSQRSMLQANAYSTWMKQVTIAFPCAMNGTSFFTAHYHSTAMHSANTDSNTGWGQLWLSLKTKTKGLDQKIHI